MASGATGEAPCGTTTPGPQQGGALWHHHLRQGGAECTTACSSQAAREAAHARAQKLRTGFALVWLLAPRGTPAAAAAKGAPERGRVSRLMMPTL